MVKTPHNSMLFWQVIPFGSIPFTSPQDPYRPIFISKTHDTAILITFLPLSRTYTIDIYRTPQIRYLSSKGKHLTIGARHLKSTPILPSHTINLPPSSNPFHNPLPF